MLSLLPLLFLAPSVSLCDDYVIYDANDLIKFSNLVNSGVNFEGTTVFLNDDIVFTMSLSQQFQPIGVDNLNYFNGTFDGQGYAINNISITAGTKYSGLFGYSEGAVIKNVVMGPFSSVVLGTTQSYVTMGGIIGLCSAKRGSCNIENCVNMAPVNFWGTASTNMYMGGISGYIYSSSNYTSVTKNCANYGLLTQTGKTTYTYMGGISGRFDGYSETSKRMIVQNCVNTAIIAGLGTTTGWLFLGGICGHGYYVEVSSCLNSGNIAAGTTSDHIGNIVGKNYESTITHCFWNDGSKYNVYGTNYNGVVSQSMSYSESTYKLNESVTIGRYSGDNLMDTLNAISSYYTLLDYSHWVLNSNEKPISFFVNNRRMSYELSAKIVLLPNLAIDGFLWFDGWYTDSGCTTPLVDSTLYAATNLYSKYKENTGKYTVSFDVTGTSQINPEPITAQCFSVVKLPQKLPKNDKCTVTVWTTDKGCNVSWDFVVPAHDITLYPMVTCTYISNADEFIHFAANVSGGANYTNTTIYLDADIDFSGKDAVVPVGNNVGGFFLGTFDGQGHVIKNLKMRSSTLWYFGLFGYTKGITIKNVVLDSSCSIERTESTGHAYIGGLIGYCVATYRPCSVESVVNMASVTFSGNADYNLYLGGIAGNLDASFLYECIVKNCANYGAVTNAGTSKFAQMGGIISLAKGYSTVLRARTQNCVNYGTISHTKATYNTLYIGGINSNSKFGAIENCVSIGKITTTNKTANLGSLVGAVSTANISNSFWTSNVGCTSGVGSGTPEMDNTTSQAEIGSDVVEKLNSYSAFNNWNRWVLNSKGATVLFVVNNEQRFGLKSQIVLLNNLADDSDADGERTFSGWYSDEELTTQFASSEVSDDTTLYGLYCGATYYVVFNVNGGDASSIPYDAIVVECNGTYGTLPVPTWSGRTFGGWYTEKEGGKKVETGDRITIVNDHVLYAHWIN